MDKNSLSHTTWECKYHLVFAHGVYKETPHLDIKRLAEINAATDIPLVLHGGSGIPNDQLDQAFVNGINKFNVGTEFFQLYYDCMKDFGALHGDKGNVFDFPIYAQERLMDYLVKKLELSKF
jgi:fructose-bisphosphate aldolase, class II